MHDMAGGRCAASSPAAAQYQGQRRLLPLLGCLCCWYWLLRAWPQQQASSLRLLMLPVLAAVQLCQVALLLLVEAWGSLLLVVLQLQLQGHWRLLLACCWCWRRVWVRCWLQLAALQASSEWLQHCCWLCCQSR